MTSILYPAHILVVDDQPAVAEVATEMLLHAGFIANFALDADAAVQIVKKAPQLDLLFTDIAMPGVDGFRLAAMSLVVRRGLRVLYTTGFSELAGELIATGEPANRIVNKPYRQAELVAAIRAALQS